ncbi:MAG TPA: hypothetical protein VGE57_01130 [Solimonas sp.]
MDTTPFPAMASHNRFCEWIDDHEQLLAAELLAHPTRGGCCALFLSRTESGDYRLRLCEGETDTWLTWRDERRSRSRFGRAYADALLQASIATLKLAGYESRWDLRLPDVQPGLLLSVAA